MKPRKTGAKKFDSIFGGRRPPGGRLLTSGNLLLPHHRIKKPAEPKIVLPKPFYISTSRDLSITSRNYKVTTRGADTFLSLNSRPFFSVFNWCHTQMKYTIWSTILSTFRIWYQLWCNLKCDFTMTCRMGKILKKTARRCQKRQF